MLTMMLFAITACEKDEQETTISGILPNKITQITWNGVFDSGTESETYNFKYDNESITSGFGYFTYQNNSVVVNDLDNEPEGTFIIEDAKAISFKLNNGKTTEYNYQNGYLTSFSSNGSQYKFTMQDGKLTKYTIKNDNVDTEYSFEYNGQKNNLNIDLFTLADIFEYHYEYASRLGLIGNRFEYLPTKITETTVFNNQTTSSTISFEYKMLGQYISQIIISTQEQSTSFKEIYSIEY